MKDRVESGLDPEEKGDEVWELLGRVRGVRASDTFRADVMRAVRADEAARRGGLVGRVFGSIRGWCWRPAALVPAGLLACLALFFVVVMPLWDGGGQGGQVGGQGGLAGQGEGMVPESPDALDALAGAIPAEEKLIFLSDYEALLAVEDSGELGDAEIAMLFGW